MSRALQQGMRNDRQQQPRKQPGHALTAEQLASATGGSRYGSGPDFEDKKSGTGNYPSTEK